MSAAVLGRLSCGVGDPWAVRRRTLEGVVVAFKAAVGQPLGWGRAGPGQPSAPPARLRVTARHTGRGRPVRKRQKASIGRIRRP